ncbi:MAG: RNA pseudouridine synthase [Treponema sp.]|nr:MAG: RNA pseudouridine synthase [Treponema sp.]
MQTGLNLQDNKNNQSDKIRLQVYLAHSGVASRRASEKIIQEGRVTVNGKTVDTLGAKVDYQDIVTVDGKKIEPEKKKIYILMNKPVGYISSLSDTHGRPVAADLLKSKYKERLYNVGRLDMFSGGALIFTNDGEFSALIQHPSAEIEKEYFVETVYDFDEQKLNRFEKGIRIEGVFYKCVHAEKTNKNKMRIVLTEGKNREIRNVLRELNIRIKKLTRIRIGNINLGNLQYGKLRELSESEIQGLIKLAKRK